MMAQRHAFNLSPPLLLSGLLLLLTACGEDPERVMTRVRYLQNKEQYDEAITTALKGADHVPNKDRAELLLKAVELAHTQNALTGKKTYATQSLEILKTLMDEKLLMDGQPEAMAAKIFDSHGKFEKASKYLMAAEKIAATQNMDLAGNYRIDLVQLFNRPGSKDQAIKEAKVFLNKYPRHPRREEMENTLYQLEAELESQWQAQYASPEQSSE